VRWYRHVGGPESVQVVTTLSMLMIACLDLHQVIQCRHGNRVCGFGSNPDGYVCCALPLIQHISIPVGRVKEQRDVPVTMHSQKRIASVNGRTGASSGCQSCIQQRQLTWQATTGGSLHSRHCFPETPLLLTSITGRAEEFPGFPWVTVND
jgi:hypothetical protein